MVRDVELGYKISDKLQKVDVILQDLIFSVHGLGDDESCCHGICLCVLGSSLCTLVVEVLPKRLLSSSIKACLG